MNRYVQILVLLFFCSGVRGQLPYWSKVYDYCPDTAMHSSINVAQCPEDSFFVAAGLHWRPGSNFWQSYVSSIDYNGNLLHRQTLDFAGKYNRPNGFDISGTTNPLIKTYNGNYVLTGFEYDLHSNSRTDVRQPWLYFFNKNCDSIRYIKYTDTIVSRIPYAIVEDRNRDLVITGIITSETIHQNPQFLDWYSDTGYVWLAKYDSLGNELWSRKYFPNQNYGVGLSGLPNGLKVIIGNDANSYIIAACIANKTKGYFEVMLMKTDTAGNMLWQKSLPKPYLSWNDIDIVALKGGGYGFISTYNDTLPVGWGGTVPGGDPLLYYGKLDEWGDTIWTRTYRAPNSSGMGKQILENAGGDLLLLSKVGRDGKYHSAVTRTDSVGRIKWYREYAHIDTGSLAFQHNLTTLTTTPSKQLLLTGSFTCSIATPGVFDSTGQFSWFVLTDTFGCIEPGCQVGDTVWEHYYEDVRAVNNNNTRVAIFPNPATNEVYIEAFLPPGGRGFAGCTAEVTDMFGRKLLTAELQGGRNAIDIAHLPVGVYMVRVSSEGKVTGSSKLVKQ